MQQKDNVLLAWLGTVAAFSLDVLSVWISIIAGLLTIIYTGMKIFSWIDNRVNKQKRSGKMLE